MAKYEKYIGKWWSLTGYGVNFFVIKIKPESNYYNEVFIVDKNGYIATRRWSRHWMKNNIKQISFLQDRSRKAIINIFEKSYNG